MSINTQRSLSQLKKECKDLGLQVSQSGSRESKTDYIKALRSYYLKTNYPNGIPKSLDLILKIESPMLCQRYTVLNPDEQSHIWDSNSWIAEQKEDGCRMVICFFDKEFDFYSRNISVTDYLPISYKDKFWLGNVDKSFIDCEFIIDSEVVSTNPNVSTVIGRRGVVTESQLQAVSALMAMNSEDSINIQKNEGCPLEFRIFDCLYYNGEWLLDKPLIERVKIAVSIIKKMQSAGIQCRRPHSTHKNKRAFYKAMITAGNEGVVLKNIYSPYIASNSRRRDAWIKVKRTMSETQEMLGLSDTVDAFVSGFEPADKDKSWSGLVGALEFSVYLTDKDGNKTVHKIARITNISMELRQKITEHNENGEPVLKLDWYGRVASIDGQCVSGRNKRLKHARLIEWRPDRSEDSCIMDEEFLNSMIL